MIQIILFAILTSASAEPVNVCASDSVRRDARSKELQAIVKADQDERANWDQKTPEEMNKVAQRDEVRRKRVGEIFGEGCFTTAQDFAAAALVFQHGNIPDHYFQTFIWSKRAVDLGDESSKRMMALAIDRYLVNIGHKQLFGSQATKLDMKPGTCWCLDAVEKSFPDQRRKEYLGRTHKGAYAWLKELNGTKSCPSAECPSTLKATPKQTIPGFW